MNKPNKNKPGKFFERRPIKKAAPAQPAATASDTKEKNKKSYNVVRGMHDILPKDEKYWLAFQREAESLAAYFQFGRIETPILEEANLFIRSIGRGTDVVDKEMYVFEDRDGSKVALRPESTASVARAYIGNGLWNQAQPVKLWNLGPMFRHDRPQQGRYREFNQLSFETIGVKDPAIDAELMLVAFNFYKDLGLPVEVRVNSIGTAEERNRYKTELVNYYRTKRSYLCEDCRARLTKNPLRLLDCKEEQCQPVKEEAPQIIDWLTEDSKNYFMKVLEYLDEVAVPYVLAPFLVRGLDYYTHTVFEIFPIQTENEAAQSALGGGGRYDTLVEELGGKSAPAAGFSLGLERAVSALKQQGPNQSATFAEKKPHVFFAQLGEEAKRRGLKIINELKDSGLRIAYNFFKTSLKTQLEVANAEGVAYVLILGQKEVQDTTIIIRDMESGVQEIVDQKKVESALKKKMGIHS